ncbi:MAG: GNAT family N-acetyltransferase, partial [Bacteroidales bacterium]
QFIDLFFKYQYQDNALVYEMEGKIVSMAFLLPATIFSTGKYHPVTYVYACATDEKYRGLGLMREIIRKAYRDACAKGEAGLFLLPASEELYTYYGKIGFRTFFYKQQSFAVAGVASSISYSLAELTAFEYTWLRPQFLKTSNSIHWPLNHFQLLENDNKTRCPQFFSLTFQDDKKAIGFYYKENDEIRVLELLGSDKAEEALLSFFNDRYFLEELNSIIINKPRGDIPYGMIWLNQNISLSDTEKGYFAFALD